jgi:hypothetical protein
MERRAVFWGASLGAVVSAGTLAGDVEASHQDFDEWVPVALCTWDPAEAYRAAVDPALGRVYHKDADDDWKLSIHCPLLNYSGYDSAGERWGISTSELVTNSVRVKVYDGSNDTSGTPPAYCGVSGGIFCGTVDAQVMWINANASTPYADYTACPWAQTGAAEVNVFKTLYPELCSTGGYKQVNVHVQLPRADAAPGGISLLQGVRVQNVR